MVEIIILLKQQATKAKKKGERDITKSLKQPTILTSVSVFDPSTENRSFCRESKWLRGSFNEKSVIFIQGYKIDNTGVKTKCSSTTRKVFELSI